MRPAATAAALAMALLIAALAWQTRAWTDQGGALAAMLPWWLSFALLWALLTYLPPREGGGWRAGLLVLAVALAARLAIVCTAGPTLSDDLWRYIHDGYTLGVAGSNPYATPPAEHNPLDLPINHPHLVTIYQPTSQWVFAGLARIAADERTFRLGFAVADLLIVLLLIVALRREQQTPWLAALWAWHPLVLTEVAGSGHQDVLGIAPLLAAVLLLEREPGRMAWRVVAAAVLLALSIAVKPIVAPLLLPAAWALRRRPAALGAGLLAGAVTLAALYGPFALMPGGLAGLWTTGRTFVDTWAANGSVHPLVTRLVGDHTIASLLCAAALLALLIAWTWAAWPLRKVAMLYLFAALLLSSTVHPWYVLWPLAFVPLVRGGAAMAVWVFSAAVVLAYTAHLSPTGEPSPAAVAAEYVLVYAATTVATVAALRRPRGRAAAAT